MYLPWRIIGVFVLGFSWFSFMLTSVIYSICHDGFKHFISHFTNWSWSLQMIFFYLMLNGFFAYDRLFKITIDYLLFPIWTNSWVVFILVLILELRNGNFVLDNVAYYKSGKVFFGNALYHFIPPLIYALLVFAIRPEIIKIFDVKKKRYSKTKKWLYVIYTMIAPFFFLVLYIACYDFQKVYQTTLPFYIGLIVSLLVSVIFNTLCLSVLLNDNQINYIMYKKDEPIKNQQI